MGTRNFLDCVDNFPLVVFGDKELLEWYGDTMENNEEGYELLEARLDEWILGMYDEVKTVVDHFNDKLSWYEVSLVSGYYSGIQLYVEVEDGYTLDELTDEEDADIMEWRYEVDSKAELIALVEREKALITEFMDTIVKEYGFKEISCIGVFNNGEAIYEYK